MISWRLPITTFSILAMIFLQVAVTSAMRSSLRPIVSLTWLGSNRSGGNGASTNVGVGCRAARESKRKTWEPNAVVLMLPIPKLLATLVLPG